MDFGGLNNAELQAGVVGWTEAERVALIEGRIEDALAAGVERLRFVAEADRRAARN